MIGREVFDTSDMRLGLLLIATAAIAQEPVFKSGVSIVEVPVVAKDAADKPIADLNQSDLRVFDNGVEQTILSFEKMRGIVRATGKPTTRLSVILLDTLNSPWATQVYGRKAISEMLGKLPQGSDRIAIFALGNELRLLHDFSNDPSSLRASVDRYTGGLPANGVDAPLAPSRDRAPLPASSAGPQGARGIVDAPPPPAAPPPNRTQASQQEQRILTTLNALQTIAKKMKKAPGGKNLLWVTSGFRPPDRMHEDIRRTMQTLADAKILLYPIDARGVVSAHAFDQAMALGEFAEQTGGRVYMNNNDTASFIRDAIEDSREGYVLTYTPTNVKGVATHVIKLETSRKGVSLRYRPGYQSAVNERQ